MDQDGPSNFELHIRRSSTQDDYLVTARLPVADQLVEGRLTLPITDGAVTAFLKALAEGTIETADLQAFGAQLFNALFQGPIRDLYLSVLASQGRAFRYRLIIDAPEIARLPWELLYDPDRRLFLALERSIVRGVSTAEPTQPLRVKPPLRILIAASFPTDLVAVEGQYEIDSLLHELADLIRRKDAEVVPLLNASLRTLQNALREAAVQGRPYHVLHIIAHGYHDPDIHQTFLVLEDEQGQSQLVDPDALVHVLRPFDLKLIYLNGCDTAALSAFDIGRGFAPALMAIGTPAVIGMQVAIWDRTAQRLAQDFYAALADNQAVDQALLGARQLVPATARHGATIAIPVCYLRTPSGQIVDVVKPAAVPLTWATWREWLKTHPTPRKLAQAIMGILSLLAILLAVYWGLKDFWAEATPTSIPPMTGDLRIAIAAFSQLDSQGRATESNKGFEFAKELAEHIRDGTQDLQKADHTIAIYGPELVGFIPGIGSNERARNAQELALELDASILLYGEVVVALDGTRLTSYVYVSPGQLLYAEELAGVYQFGEPIEVPLTVENPAASRVVREEIAQRSVSLSKFIAGLGNFAMNQTQLAAQWFAEAESVANGDKKILRTVLLFLGSTAARQLDMPTALTYYKRSLAVDPNYARAQLGYAQTQFFLVKGNCQPDQVDLQSIDAVLQGYEHALSMSAEPFEEVPTKVALYRGDVYLCLTLAEVDIGDPKGYFDQVTERYRATEDPRVRYLAAAAWQSLGNLYLQQSNQDTSPGILAKAETAFRESIALSKQPVELAVNHAARAEVHIKQDNCQAAQEDLAAAEAIYQESRATDPIRFQEMYEGLRQQVEAHFKTQCPSFTVNF
jgi:tetratricopeptide (TPR) repeat protein